MAGGLTPEMASTNTTKISIPVKRFTCFGELPPEIRQGIWEFLLPGPRTICPGSWPLKKEHSDPVGAPDRDIRIQATMASTMEQIYIRCTALSAVRVSTRLIMEIATSHSSSSPSSIIRPTPQHSALVAKPVRSH